MPLIQGFLGGNTSHLVPIFNRVSDPCGSHKFVRPHQKRIHTTVAPKGYQICFMINSFEYLVNTLRLL